MSRRAPYELDEVPTSSVTDPTVRYRVAKMRFGAGKDRTTIVYNAHLTLEGIPERAYGYEVNGRPAIEWIIDRYQVRTDKTRASSTTRTPTPTIRATSSTCCGGSSP